MKKIGIITAGIFLLISLVVIRYMKKQRSAALYSIGILQTASHPALDAVREGFIEYLKEVGGNTIASTVYNAQGSVSTAHALAQQLHAHKKFDAFLTIATPATQALSAVEKERPIVIAAVTDPHELGLIYSGSNVTGTQDMIDVTGQIDMITQLVPSAKTVGLLYTAGEPNSIALVSRMRSELEHRGLTAIDFAVTQETDMPAMVERAARTVDVILAPTDNTVASAITLIASRALQHSKPLFVSDNMLISSGPLAARGVDYKESGRQAGRMLYEMLTTGLKPDQLPIEQAKSENIYINKKTLDSLGLIVPASLEKQVTFVS